MRESPPGESKFRGGLFYGLNSEAQKYFAQFFRII